MISLAPFTLSGIIIFSMTRHIENFKIGCQEYEFLSLKFLLAIFVETGTIGEKITM